MDGEQRLPHVEGRPDDEREDERDSARGIFCARCAHALTSVRQRIEKSGRHAHTFMNPSGIVFHVRCFGEVPGARVHGEAEREMSWFPGTAWRFASCDACVGQIGWWYAEAESAFFALIEDCIVER